MKKVFLSLPMSSQTDEQVLQHIESMKQTWNEFANEDYMFVDSFINNLSEDYYTNRDHYNCACLGTALIKLAECDAIFMGIGWANSRGCKLEYMTAQSYGIKVYFENGPDSDHAKEMEEYKNSIIKTIANFEDDVNKYIQEKKEENKLIRENMEEILRQAKMETPKEPEAVLPVIEEVIPEVKIRYFHEKYGDYPEIEQKGNFIDICLPEDTTISAKGYGLINLGIATELPDGYWAQLVPRSSTFKKYGLILTNSFGVIDTEYKGDGDEWMAMMYNMYGKDAVLPKGTRILQFRIVKDHPVKFDKVDHLGNADRGGFGSTGN